jgi:hypothetical protein
MSLDKPASPDKVFQLRRTSRGMKGGFPGAPRGIVERRIAGHPPSPVAKDCRGMERTTTHARWRAARLAQLAQLVVDFRIPSRVEMNRINELSDRKNANLDV